MPSSRGSSQPRSRTRVSHIAGGLFTVYWENTCKSLHPWDKSHLIMMGDPFNVLLDSFCQYFLRIFASVFINHAAAAAAAAKSLQSCSTLCDPIDGLPPGSSVPGILQERILEWVAIFFSNACMHAKSLQLCPTLCDPMDSSPPGSSVHRILQTRILEWIINDTGL